MKRFCTIALGLGLALVSQGAQADVEVEYVGHACLVLVRDRSYRTELVRKARAFLDSRRIGAEPAMLNAPSTNGPED